MLGLVQKVQNEVAAQENIVTHLKCFTDVSRQNTKRKDKKKKTRTLETEMGLELERVHLCGLMC